MKCAIESEGNRTTPSRIMIRNNFRKPKNRGNRGLAKWDLLMFRSWRNLSGIMHKPRNESDRCRQMRSAYCKRYTIITCSLARWIAQIPVRRVIHYGIARIKFRMTNSRKRPSSHVRWRIMCGTNRIKRISELKLLWRMGSSILFFSLLHLVQLRNTSVEPLNFRVLGS